MTRPDTIENRWDILYRDYPEVYDEFATVPANKNWIDVAGKIYSFKGKTVADIGSGTGKSTFEIAKWAKLVIGIEPEDAMRKIAINRAKALGINNVIFKKGKGEEIPLANESVDITVAVTAANFYNRENICSFDREAIRITHKGGYVSAIEFAPGWYGGDLAAIILGRKNRVLDYERVKDIAFTEFGFSYRDFYLVRDYESVAKTIRTYGFIFGKKAIDYIREHNKTTVKWRARIYFKKV
jgi:ubiquinone/menaquinone biosynthesis C-methylase UbiE